MSPPRITRIDSDGRRNTWRCSTCDKPLQRGHGWIELIGSQMALAYDALRHADQMIARAYRTTGLPQMTTGADLLDMPGPAHWRATCRTCNGDDAGSGYFIEVAQISSLAAVLDWTAHLSQKVWLEHTDWDDVCRLVAAAAIRRAVA